MAGDIRGENWVASYVSVWTAGVYKEPLIINVYFYTALGFTCSGPILIVLHLSGAFADNLDSFNFRLLCVNFNYSCNSYRKFQHVTFISFSFFFPRLSFLSFNFSEQWYMKQWIINNVCLCTFVCVCVFVCRVCVNFIFFFYFQFIHYKESLT